MDIKSIIKQDINYTFKNNVYCFIDNDDDRPQWSKNLNTYLVNNPKTLQLKRNYTFYRNNVKNDLKKSKLFQYLSESGGIIVDLASGPSGYFSPIFDYMKEDGIFVVTDACKAIINAHQRVNKDQRFYIFDVDLGKVLPFNDGSIDAFSGNLLNNVDNYRNLLFEISRCLKPGGRFGLIEWFYEKDSKTYEYLKERNAVYSSLEHFIGVCKEVGLEYLESQVYKEIVGKANQGDLLPIGENDKCLETIVYLKKKTIKRLNFRCCNQLSMVMKTH